MLTNKNKTIKNKTIKKKKTIAKVPTNKKIGFNKGTRKNKKLRDCITLALLLRLEERCWTTKCLRVPMQNLTTIYSKSSIPF